MDDTTASGDQALERLRHGNQRYVRARPDHPDQSSGRRAEVAQGQHPFAVILGCSDSRVPPEIVFDQGLGDLFVIRTAGNVFQDVALGSIEYAILHLHTPLLLVLGHQRCGAVTAAVQGGENAGHIDALVRLIEPAVRATEQEPGSHIENAVAANAMRVAQALIQESEPIQRAHEAGKLTVASAVYSLDTGEVRFL